MSAFIKVFVILFVIGCLLVGSFVLMHSYPALGALCVVFIIAFVSACIITYDGE